MKRKTTKILAILLAAICIFSFSACTDKEELTGAKAFAAESVENYISSIDQARGQLDQMLEYYQESPLDYDSILAYKNATEAMGTMLKYETDTVTETEDNVYNVKGLAHFENGDMEVSTVVTVGVDKENRKTGEITYGIVDGEPVKFDTIKTVGEKLKNAGLNTMLGMFTVFIVLILISFIIYLFKFVNKAENSIAERKAAKANKGASEKAAEQAVEEAVSETDDMELVAVIAAAIAAYEGTSPDGVIVRSIRKVSSKNKWKRG